MIPGSLADIQVNDLDDLTAEHLSHQRFEMLSVLPTSYG